MDNLKEYLPYTIVYKWVAGDTCVLSAFNDPYGFGDKVKSKSIAHSWLASFLNTPFVEILWEGSYYDVPEEYCYIEPTYRDQTEKTRDKDSFNRALAFYSKVGK